MAHLKKSAATGHLLKNSDGHLINDCGWMNYTLVSGNRIDGGGDKTPYAGAPDPNAADYAHAWGDAVDGLPDGSSPGPTSLIDLGYEWPDTVITSAIVNAFGQEWSVDTSDLASVTSAQLTVEIENLAANDWDGEVTFEIRYDDAAPALADLGDAFSYGTLAGTITVDNGNTESDTWVIPIASIDVTGTFYVIIYPDCSDNPGYPGGDHVYTLECLATALLQVKGTLD